MIYTHFGSDHFDESLWTDVSGSTHCGGLKPNGGLWEENGCTWKNWCESNAFDTKRLNSYFKFRLTDNARLLKVFYNELDRYKVHNTWQEYDWLKIKADYDAVYIPAGSDYNLYMKYYG